VKISDPEQINCFSVSQKYFAQLSDDKNNVWQNRRVALRNVIAVLHPRKLFDKIYKYEPPALVR